MFDFGIFCYLLRLMGIYRMGPVRVFEKFRSLFSFLLFIFFFFTILHFFFFFFFFTLGGPFSSGAPGHRPHMPPSRYATGLGAVQKELHALNLTLENAKEIAQERQK